MNYHRWRAFQAGMSSGKRPASPGAAPPARTLLGALALVSGLLLAACSGPSSPRAVDDSTIPPDAASAVVTDSATYRLSSDPIPAVLVTARFTNTTGAAVYIPTAGCGGFSGVERRVGESWEPVFSPVCTLEYREPAVVAPGASYRLTAWVPVRTRSTDNGISRDSLPQDYRAVFSIFRNWNPARATGELLPPEMRVSNTFTIEP